jgi:arginine/serine-rich splicing factor 16
MQAATDAVYNNPKPGGGPPPPSGPAGLPSGSGQYSAIGFSYDAGATAGIAGAAGAESSSDDSSSDESDSEGEDDLGAGVGPLSEADLAQEAEDDRVDEMAEGFGLQDFSYRLHKSLEKEGEEEARMRNPPRYGILAACARCRGFRLEHMVHACCMHATNS